MNSRYIIYSALYKEKLVYETLYSLLTLFKKNTIDNKTKIIIYTNFADIFQRELKKKALPFASYIIIEDINDAVLKSWIYKDYLYTIKIHVLRHFFEKYKANALFIDSDMFAKDNIIPLFNIIEKGEFVFYNCLKTIYEKFLLDHFEEFHYFITHSNQSIKYEHLHYQSGILGINYMYRNMLDTIYNLCIDIYNHTNIHESEEIAFSCILQNINTIHLANCIFGNYSGMESMRLFIGYTLQTFFKNDETMLKKLLSQINLDTQFLKHINLTYDNIECFFDSLLAFMVSRRNKVLTTIIKTDKTRKKDRQLYKQYVMEIYEATKNNDDFCI